jgi:CelD/BcsL family acetyltransferase involved in cellulose biosynthesis
VADDGWQRGPAPLKFQLGDVVLAEARLTLYRRSAGLQEAALDAATIPPPPPSLKGAAGYVVWSQPISSRLPVLRTRDRSILYAPRQYRRFLVDLSGGFDQYMAGFSGKTRSGLKRKLRKFGELSGGNIDLREYRTPEEIAEFVSMARVLSAKTYQERLLRRGLPGTDDFLGSAQALAREDNVRAYLLFLSGEPISYLYSPVKDGVVLYDYLGYDPARASISPGTVLQLLVLERLFAERRFMLFDFTEGEGQHKELFSTESRLCADFYVLRRRLWPMSLILLHRAVDRTSAVLGTTFDRLHLKSRMRRLMRGT